MRPETLAAIRLLLSSDSTVDVSKSEEILAACRRERPGKRRLGTVRQAAEALGCHPKTIQRYADKGVLRPIRFSPRKVRYDMDEVEAFARDGIGGANAREAP